MKLENQVCTLEQAIQLKELGVEQEALNFWKCNELQNAVVCGCSKETNKRFFGFNTWYAAFDVAELGVMLPEMFASRYGAGAWICYNDCMSESDLFGEENKEDSAVGLTEAEVRAGMLIYLLGKSFITPAEVNARLIA